MKKCTYKSMLEGFRLYLNIYVGTPKLKKKNNVFRNLF